MKRGASQQAKCCGRAVDFHAALDCASEVNILLKGAPETVIERCALSESEFRRINDAMATYARQGMRVIAFAQKKNIAEDQIQPEAVHGDLLFAGLLCMIDPPRTEAMDAIRICHSAGITVKMITGDIS